MCGDSFRAAAGQAPFRFPRAFPETDPYRQVMFTGTGEKLGAFDIPGAEYDIDYGRSSGW